MKSQRVPWKESKMSKAEWSKKIDDFLAQEPGKAGKERLVEWPGKPEGYHFGLVNKHITMDMIIRFAYAVGDPNPLWRDPDYAKNTRWGGVIAPPVAEHMIGTPWDFPVAIFWLNTIGGMDIFDAGASHEYFGVIRPGDEFTATDKYLGTVEKTKPGKAYRLFLARNEKKYFNQRGEMVARGVGGVIVTGIPPGETSKVQEQIAANIKRPRYTEAELDALHRAYDEELEGKWRQGAAIRYWEDVKVGEEIHPVVKGPLDDSDAMKWIQATGECPGAFAIKWGAIRAELDRAAIDPETGEYRAAIDWHHSDTMAREVGIPYALGYGAQNQAIVAHGVTNWMGDDAFVKKLDLQNRGVNYYGDMNWIKGKVVRKYVDKGEHLVDLDVWAECQDGRIHTKGIATVRLISREK